MENTFLAYIFFGWPLGFIAPASVLVSGLLKPDTPETYWFRTLQRVTGFSGLGIMAIATVLGAPIIGGFLAPLVYGAGLLLILIEALAGQWRAALVDLGLLSLAPLIGYALIAAIGY